MFSQTPKIPDIFQVDILFRVLLVKVTWLKIPTHSIDEDGPEGVQIQSERLKNKSERKGIDFFNVKKVC